MHVAFQIWLTGLIAIAGLFVLLIITWDTKRKTGLRIAIAQIWGIFTIIIWIPYSIILLIIWVWNR